MRKLDSFPRSSRLPLSPVFLVGVEEDDVREASDGAAELPRLSWGALS